MLIFLKNYLIKFIFYEIRKKLITIFIVQMRWISFNFIRSSGSKREEKKRDHQLWYQNERKRRKEMIMLLLLNFVSSALLDSSER